jgi:hypothetical protein
MNKAKICVQAMMINNSFMDNGAYNTFKKLSDIGFHCVELSQVPMDSESPIVLIRKHYLLILTSLFQTVNN